MTVEEADGLYDLDPGDFVAGRTALVRSLRVENKREVAAEVAKLRRPSPAAWAVNQLVRTQRSEVEHLVRLGEELRTAQEEALAGADPADLRQAARARREAVAALTEAAGRLLAGRGAGGEAHLAGVASTLEAASLDAGAGTEVLDGRLSGELEPPSGFGEVAWAPLPSGPTGKTVPRAAPPAPAQPPPPSSELLGAQKDAADAARRADELAAAARTTSEVAAQRRRAVDEAQADVDRLRHALEEAERRLSLAGEEARAAGRIATEAGAAAFEAGERRRVEEERLWQLRPDR